MAVAEVAPVAAVSEPATALVAAIPAAKKGKYMRPPCPTCGAADVKTLGGGTHGKYRYVCNSCGVNWQQVPPHKLQTEAEAAEPVAAAAAAEQPAPANSVQLDNQTRKRQISQPYKCGRCGLPKKGHTCVSGDPMSPIQNDVPPVAAAAVAAAETAAAAAAVAAAASGVMPAPLTTTLAAGAGCNGMEGVAQIPFVGASSAAVLGSSNVNASPAIRPAASPCMPERAGTHTRHTARALAVASH